MYFDDAFMFYRYAMNIRHGLGWSWNLDGIPTYGMTSLTWQFVVLLFSFLPGKPIFGLFAASLLTFLAAAAYLSLFVARHSRSGVFRDSRVALLFVTLPLLLQYAFLLNIVNGMDTMLGMFCNAGIACLSVVAARNASLRLAVVTAVVSYLSIATRPESALCAFAVPALAFGLLARPRRLSLAALHVGLTALLVTIQVAVCTRYFGTPVPLAFYLKTLHAYAGFTGYEGASRSVAHAISYLMVYLVALLVFARRSRLPILLVLLVPAVLTMVYLSTVIQIMGYQARYYVPYFPYIQVAAWLVLDDVFASTKPIAMPSWRRLGSAGLLLVLTSWSNSYFAVDALERQYVAAHPPLPVPQLLPAGTPHLPKLAPMAANMLFTNQVAAGLKPGTWIASSEVGFLGVGAPQVNILDLAGLNSRDQTMSGLNPDIMFQHNPEVVWLPHPDYTGFYGALLRDPRFLQRYDVIANAYDLGVAVRKDSPQHDAVMQRMHQAWPQVYPGTHMADYLVQR